MSIKVIELQRFATALTLYDQVGENVTAEESADIEKIDILASNGEWSALELLYAEGNEKTAKEMVLSFSGISIESLNELADEFGYMRV